MRQVPKYTIIGDGKVATHVCHYFNSLNIPYMQWSRRSREPLPSAAQISSHILLLISDDQISTFIDDHPELSGKIIIHCSGCLSIPQAIGAHPLMSFTPKLMSIEDYQAIPFIVEEGKYTFTELFPDLKNPHWTIPLTAKPYYHALCVMANNFTTLLWQKFFHEMQERYQIPIDAGATLLKQTMASLLNDPSNALTGPIARGDQSTIEKNLTALEGDAYQAVYTAFKNI